MNHLKISTFGRVLSVISGAAVFALLLLIARIVLPYALIGGVLGWLAVILLFSNNQDKVKYNGDLSTRQEVENTVRAGRKLTSAIRQSILRLSQTEVRTEIEDICKIADSILEMLKKDPNDLRIVKQFITYYLEPTVKIIVKYADLATARPMPSDAIETLERTEKSLKSIRTTFLQQKEKMLENDVMDLDTEIKVFETVSGNMSYKSSGSEEKKSTKLKKNSTPLFISTL